MSDELSVPELDPLLVVEAVELVVPPSDCRSSNSEFRSEITFESALLRPELDDVAPELLGLVEVADTELVSPMPLPDDCDRLSRRMCHNWEAPPLPIELTDMLILLHGFVQQPSPQDPGRAE